MSHLKSSSKIAFLGPEGTYTDEAAFLYAPNCHRVPFATLTDAMMATESGEMDQAVAPIENSLIGTVADTVDFLIKSERLFICAEMLMTIEACLVSLPGASIEKIEVIRSRPEAINQCRNFIKAHMPGVRLEYFASTAAAVATLSSENNKGQIAAIAPLRAARINRMNTLAHKVQDSTNNVTRFVALSNTQREPTGKDKTSLLFSFGDSDHPGLLLAALTPFYSRKINLTKLESRPTREGIGRYYFLLDCEGHSADPYVREAIKELNELASVLKIMGSYPMSTEILTPS